jgi:hypothetical protein
MAAYAFDDASDEELFAQGIMPPNYGGQGLVLRLTWYITADTTGNVIWGAQFENEPAGFDLSASSFDTAQTVTVDPVATTNQTMESDITFSSSSEIDSLTSGDQFRLRIYRDATADSFGNDALLIRAVLMEI